METLDDIRIALELRRRFQAQFYVCNEESFHLNCLFRLSRYAWHRYKVTKSACSLVWSDRLRGGGGVLHRLHITQTAHFFLLLITMQALHSKTRFVLAPAEDTEALKYCINYVDK